MIGIIWYVWCSFRRSFRRSFTSSVVHLLGECLLEDECKNSSVPLARGRPGRGHGEGGGHARTHEGQKYEVPHGRDVLLLVSAEEKVKVH